MTTITASIIFTIPSLALFVVLPLIIPTRILDEANVIVALTLYTVALLVRAVPEALDAVSPAVLDAATAVGYKPLTRMLKVELPLAVPVLIASLRVVAVTNISMVSVGSVIGIGGLGTWFTEGYQANKSDQIIAGIIAIFVLAIVIDTLIMLAGQAAHPVDPRASAPSRPSRTVKAARMNFLQQALSFIFTAANWGGPAGLTARILEHLQYTVVAVIFSALIAVPLGHAHRAHRPRHLPGRHRGQRVARAAHARRAAAGRAAVGPRPGPADGRADAARHPAAAGGHLLGHRQRRPCGGRRGPIDGHDRARVLLRVEVPNAMPLILGGLRTATLQIVATATVAAYASLGGLGRYLIDGIKVRRVLPRVGRRADGDRAGVDPRRRAGFRGVGVGARHRPAASRMPQPLLGDEVAWSRATVETDESTSSARYERGDPSPTVDG